jgi:hypothetical protein
MKRLPFLKFRHNFYLGYKIYWEPGSSVSIVASYGMSEPGSFSSRDRGFFLCPLRQAGCLTHLASCTEGTGRSFFMCKMRLGPDTGHSPLLMLRLRKREATPPLSPKHLSRHIAGLVCV